MSKPPRRRRLGGNPNEPNNEQPAEAEHHQGVGPSSLLMPLSSSLSSSSGMPLPQSSDLAMEEDAKVHDGPGMSFGATLRRSLTDSVKSLRSTTVTTTGAAAIGVGVGDRHERQRHHHYPGLTILDASIERRDWGSVLSIVNSPAGPSLSARTSHAPLFYGGRYGTTLLPLHRACMYDAPAYVIDALLRANPTAARTAESAFHRLPIHLACRSGSAQVDTVMLLLASDRDDGTGTSSSSCRDRLKRIPLHYILANGAHPTIVDDLLQFGASRCLAMADSEGWLALHVACGSGVDLGIVERLVRAHPAAMNSLTRWGSRPLDCARMFVGDRYADRVNEIFCRNLNRSLEIMHDISTMDAPLGVIHEEYAGFEGTCCEWDGVSEIARSGRPTSRFAR